MSIRMCCGITLAVLSVASCGDDDDDPIGPGSFLLAVTPTSRTAAPGTTTFVTVQLQRTGAYSGPVTLSISNTPAGVSASMDPAVFSGTTVESRVNLTVAPTAPLGTSTVSLKGTADITEYTVTFTLTIAAPN
jgi:hypothetical protein